MSKQERDREKMKKGRKPNILGIEEEHFLNI